MPELLADIGQHHVGGCADERAVAAQASAQGQRPPQGRAVEAVGLERQDDGDHGCHERDVVQEAGDDGRAEQHRQHGDHEVAARDVDKALRQHADDARFGHGADDDEQAGEEAQRGPFDAVQRLFDAFTGDEQDQAGGGKRDDAGLQAERAVGHEADDHEDDHGDADVQQAAVLDVVVLVELHDGLTVLLVCRDLTAVHDVEQADDGSQDDDDRRRIVGDEVGEGVTRGRADHDVGRVADERCRAADVRCQDLRHEERHRVYVEQAAHGDGHGTDEQHGGNVVQEGGQHSREQHEQHHDGPRVALRHARALDGQKLEHARLLHHGHEQHHAEQHAERVEVDVPDSRFERHDVQDEQQHGTGDGDKRAMHLLGHDGDHGHHEDGDGNDLASIHIPPPRLHCFPRVLLSPKRAKSLCNRAKIHYSKTRFHHAEP